MTFIPQTIPAFTPFWTWRAAAHRLMAHFARKRAARRVPTLRSLSAHHLRDIGLTPQDVTPFQTSTNASQDVAQRLRLHSNNW